MNDPTDLPTADQSAAVVAAYRVWAADRLSGDSDDDAMAAAMFANLPDYGIKCDERCVTVGGIALVARRNRQDPAGVVYQLESYAIDAELDGIDALLDETPEPEVADPVAAPTAATNPFSDLAHAETA